MAHLQTQRYCSLCGRYTLHAKDTFSGGMGCVLTLLTAGLFLPIWLLIMLVEAFKPWRCQFCGRARLL
jgi:hypothetical protein